MKREVAQHVGKTGASEKLSLLQLTQRDEPSVPQSGFYDRGWVSLACFRSNFGQLVLGCIDSYDSHQILILQGFSRSTRFTYLRTAPYSRYADFFVKKSQNVGILPIFLNFVIFVLILMKISRNFTNFVRNHQNL